jgi:hypothetical protein
MNISESMILIKAIKIKNEFIPIWKCRCEEHEEFGTVYTYNNESKSESELTNVYYDINTTEITTGIKIEYYPKNHVKKVGDKILVESSFRNVVYREILELIWDLDSNYINFGNKLNEVYGKMLGHKKFDRGTLYHLMMYKPTYRIRPTNDTDIIHEHHIYQLLKED